jgi:hypothetical protein
MVCEAQATFLFTYRVFLGYYYDLIFNIPQLSLHHFTPTSLCLSFPVNLFAYYEYCAHLIPGGKYTLCHFEKKKKQQQTNKQKKNKQKNKYKTKNKETTTQKKIFFLFCFVQKTRMRSWYRLPICT